MPVRLLVKQRGEAGGADTSTVVLLEDDTIVMGRDKTCQVQLTQQAVSRAHARITRDGALFFVEDMGSSYGTRLNGQGLPKNEKRLLRNGDIIAIAQYDLVFDRLAEEPKPDADGKVRADKTSMISRGLLKDALRGVSQSENPYFRVMNGPKEGQRIEIADAQEIVFGRDDDADVMLKDDLVSRKHAKVRRDWSGVHVEDLGSRNGIKINKKKIGRKQLKDRDELEIGGIRLLFLDPSAVREQPVVMPADDGDETVHETEEEAAKAAAEEAAAAAAEDAPAEEPPPADAASAEGEASQTKDAPSEAPPAEEPPAEAAPVETAPEEVEQPQAGGVVGKFAALTGIPASKALVPLVVAGVIALFAIVIIIALVAGA